MKDVRIARRAPFVLTANQGRDVARDDAPHADSGVGPGNLTSVVRGRR
jgi:hypothetical protein